jgi:hypothetical protein
MNHVCAGKDSIEKIRSAKSPTAAFTALLDGQTLRGRDPSARAEALAAYERTLARLKAR